MSEIVGSGNVCWVQDWQFGLKLKASILACDDLSGPKPEKIWFKAEK